MFSLWGHLGSTHGSRPRTGHTDPSTPWAGPPDITCTPRQARDLGGRPRARAGVGLAHVLCLRGFTGELISPTVGW